jgi:beta-phosphoglucomutase-like phosphatase (HAD superfamily)
LNGDETGGRDKEYPDVYLNAARQLGAEIENCLIFEDATPSLRTAKATGARTIAVREPSSQQDQTELEQSSDQIITDYRDLMPPSIHAPRG